MSTADAANPPFPPLRVAIYMLILLMAAALVSLLDRQILSLLIVPIKEEFALTDLQASLLQGLSFAVFYALAGIPIGYLVDRGNRRNLIIIAILFWSLATMAGGLAQNYGQMFITRMAVGAGEACLMPAAYSIMCDIFKPEQRGRAFTIFGGAASMGLAASLLLAATLIGVLAAMPLTGVPFLEGLPTWRIAFLICGVPGILVGALLLTVREPTRRETTMAATGQRASVIGFIKRSHRALLIIAVVGTIIQFCGFGVIAWMAAGYVRTFGMDLTQAGFTCGLILLFGTLIGAPLGGYLADWLARRDVKGGRMVIAVLTCTFGILVFPAWWLTDNVTLGVIIGIVGFTCQVAGSTSLPAALSDVTPNELRGRISAIYMLIVTVFGLGMGPTAIAVATDFVFRDEASLRYGIVVVTFIAFIVGAVIGWAGRGWYAEGLKRQSAINA